MYDMHAMWAEVHCTPVTIIVTAKIRKKTAIQQVLKHILK